MNDAVVASMQANDREQASGIMAWVVYNAAGFRGRVVIASAFLRTVRLLSRPVKWSQSERRGVHVMVLCISAFVVFVPRSRAQAPVVEITPTDSWIKFHVKSSTKIAGKFDKWDAGLTFQSPDETTGVLAIKIDAASVDTGSGMKNGKLKSKDFFDVEQNPYITFKSTKIAPTGPHTYEVDGDFTIRGVRNPEKLTLTISGKGTGSGGIHGAMVFNRKNYGMNKGIPFIKIADHVDVDFHLRWKHVGGPPLASR